MLSTYDISIALFMNNLQRLRVYLEKGEQWCKDNSQPVCLLIEGRIIEDMRPLPFQIKICCDMARIAAEKLGGAQDFPEFGPDYDLKTFNDLYGKIDSTLAAMKALDRKAFDGTDVMDIELQMPTRLLKFTGLGLLQTFVVPDFYFHAVTAYNILRKAGVPIGKMDFLGRVGDA
ncbi:hypothetical protein K431DRAFT_310840 [Polychaeton citri CBS 116435]|uniref:Uncharacterized protein n=1 Tax=Polychaeton citri CBS 116435 TaxID=1314669 RepID=A0A9P4QBK3_9PEZI|nr:hypothetical protein K431DRAFT_310840 [Polychaeton citri CBS 116435]